MIQAIYLDHNATTPVDPEVAAQMQSAQLAGYANPASPHAAGRAARHTLEEAREGIACMLGVDQSGLTGTRVIFTSGGTEANNLAILGLVGDRKGRVLISAIEHPSVVGAAEHLARRGYEVMRIPVSQDGVVLLSSVVELLTENTQLVSVMLGNNETGVLQPVGELARICAQAGVPLHTDAVQVVGKLPVHFSQLGVSALSATAHKFHGPRGIGVLIVKGDMPIQPLLHGGFQQEGIRPGTESVALVLGMHKALGIWQRESDRRSAQMSALRDRLESLIRSELPWVVIPGSGAPRLPHTSNLSFPGLDRQAMLMALDLAGVACSTGSACASGSTEPSPTLLAMGCEQRVVEGSLRVSLGATTTPQEVEQAAARILRIAKGLRDKDRGRILAIGPREQARKTL